MKKILIVDDHPETVRLLEVILRGEGRQLYRADNGDRALELARKIKPDLMLLDVMMPGTIDGFQVARSLKEDPESRSIRIIIMTAKTQERDREEAFDSGADEYLAKPFDVLKLKTVVEKFL